jgi:hypothetical protein
MCTVSFPVLAINSNTLRTVRSESLSVRSSKLSNCPEKVHRDMMTSQLLTRVTYLSRCVEYIINPLQHQKRHVKAVKIEDSMKPISGSQHMKSGSTKAPDQFLPIGR